MTDSLLRTEYLAVKKSCLTNWRSAEAGNAIWELAVISLRFLLDQCQLIDLVSRVPGKRYFTFRKGNVFARPTNEQFFISDLVELSKLWDQWLGNTINTDDFAKLTYTVSLAPCLAMEIFDRQKTLTSHYPDVIAIKSFGEFFTESEREAVLRS